MRIFPVTLSLCWGLQTSSYSYRITNESLQKWQTRRTWFWPQVLMGKVTLENNDSFFSHMCFYFLEIVQFKILSPSLSLFSVLACGIRGGKLPTGLNRCFRIFEWFENHHFLRKNALLPGGFKSSVCLIKITWVFKHRFKL